MITLKHLMIFKEVARVKSMSKAAENLYISQPTVSQKIQEIEEYYHIKLFQRYSKSLGISEEGQIFLNHTNKILDELDTIDEIFFYKKETINLRIGSTLTIANTLTPKLLKDIKKYNPQFNFQVYVDNTQKIEDLILNNQIDIALVEGEIHNDMIIQEQIIHDQLMIVCSTEHELARYDEITPEQLSHQEFILREKGSGTRALFEQFMNRHKLPYVVSWECHSWDSIKQAVLHNHGLTIISVRLVEEEIKKGLLHAIKLTNTPWTRKFSLIYHRNKTWNDNLELFKQSSIHHRYCPVIEMINALDE